MSGPGSALWYGRQKQRENKRYSKAVQAERQKEKAQQKKANITDLTRLRKQRQKSVGFLDILWPSLHAHTSTAGFC